MPPADPKLHLLVRHSDSSKDRALANELLGHLKPLQRFANLDVWSDARLRAGDETRREIERAIDQADVVLLLLSADFFASDTLLDVEVPKLMERHRQGSLKVVPVLLRSCLWEAHPWLSELRPLPRDGKAVASHQGDTFDRAMTELVREVSGLVTPSSSGSATTGASGQAAGKSAMPAKEAGAVYNITIQGSNIGGLGVGEGTKVVGSVGTSASPTADAAAPSTGKATSAPSAGRTSAPPRSQEFTAEVAANGTSLIAVVGGADAGRLTHEDCKTDEEAELVGDLLQECQDLLDIWSELPVRQQVETARSLSKQIDALTGAGWVVLVARTRERGKTADGKPLTFEVANIRVVRIDGPDLVPAPPAPVKSPSPIDPTLQSVYLSYDPADEAFVERLFQALEAQGVAAFYFPEHAPAGQKLGRVARVGVNQHDRMVLFCSKASLTSPRVLNELDETLEREAREGGSARLIPIKLDGFVSSPDWKPPNADVVHAVTGRVMVDLIGADRDAVKLEKGVRRLIAALKG